MSQINQSPTTFSTYVCDEANIILDAWVAGTIAGQLAVVVYEGRGDEDHPDYASLLLIKEDKTARYRFIPNFDLRMSLLQPYRLLLAQKGLFLVTARLADDGISIVAAELPAQRK